MGLIDIFGLRRSSHVMRGRSGVKLAVLAAVALAAVACRLLISRSLGGEVNFGWPDQQIAAFRWGAIGSGAVIGASLAASGTMLQCLLRNPLASPFTLGISTGSGVGIMVALYAGWVTAGTTSGYGGVAPAAIGSLATLAIVWGLGYRRGALDPLSLVLAGVILSALGGAAILFLQFLIPHGLRGDLVVWMMGRVPEQAERTTLLVSAGVAITGIGLGWWLGKAMDVASMGDDEAWSVGVSLPRLRTMLLLTAGCLTAAAVALAGPIAFVGLIAPHASRMILGSRHRMALMGSVLIGMAMIIGADALRQVINLGGGRIPVGVFTAAVGGPTFLWLLGRTSTGFIRA